MQRPNRLHRMTQAFNALPAPLRRHAHTWIMGNVVPFVGTARLDIQELAPERVVVRVRNRRRNRNHIGQVHAAAMALVAETATGFVVGLNVPDDKVPLIKSMQVRFRRRSHGALVATASLSPEQREAMITEAKGDVLVPVEVRDERGEAPVECEMVWAWVPRKRA